MLPRTRSLSLIARRAYSQVIGGGIKKPAAAKPAAAPVAPSSAPADLNANVTGLKCVKSAAGPVGPGATADGPYKVPEYFLFDRFSYAEAEVEMAKYRCPQPSAVKK